MRLVALDDRAFTEYNESSCTNQTTAALPRSKTATSEIRELTHCDHEQPAHIRDTRSKRIGPTLFSVCADRRTSTERPRRLRSVLV